MASWQTAVKRAGQFDLANNRAIGEHAIAITDKQHPHYEVVCLDWLVSNPKGYGVWFRSRQAAEFDRRKRSRFDARIWASVEDVPDHKVKTPLQMTIQILKRHRDAMFGDDEDKPISIIITTLAALAYRGEQMISDSLRSILITMDQFITRNAAGVAVVANPVNPAENFADKWPDHPAREKKFYAWLDAARRDFGAFFKSGIAQLPPGFRASMTETTIRKIEPLIAPPNLLAGIASANALAGLPAHPVGATTAPAVARGSSNTLAAAISAEAERMSRQGKDHKPWAARD